MNFLQNILNMHRKLCAIHVPSYFVYWLIGEWLKLRTMMCSVRIHKVYDFEQLK